MNKRPIFLIILAVVLALVYARFFTDWLDSKNIQIHCRIMPKVLPHGGEKLAVTFFLGKRYRLTSLKVISVDDAQTNKYPHALWHLVSDTNSVPTEEFSYGSHIGGMKSNLPQASAEPLQPDQRYMLIVEAQKKIRGEIQFKTHAVSPN